MTGPCFDCALHKHTPPTTLLGSCTWFPEPKPIPPTVIDVGCKFFKPQNTGG